MCPGILGTRRRKDKYLELAKNVDENAPVKHGLAIHGRDEVSNLLEAEARDLLHDLQCAQRFFSDVTSDQGRGSGSAFLIEAGYGSASAPHKSEKLDTDLHYSQNSEEALEAQNRTAAGRGR